LRADSLPTSGQAAVLWITAVAVIWPVTTDTT